MLAARLVSHSFRAIFSDDALARFSELELGYLAHIVFRVLHKRKGRNGGLFKFGWSERWFELLQGHEATPPVLHYFEGERKDKAQEPKGVIVINQGSVLMRSPGMATKHHEHVFAVSTQEGAKTITTVLAGQSPSDLERWTSAIDRALGWFKPSEVGGQGRKKDRKTDEEKDLHKKTPIQLLRMLEYMGVAGTVAIGDKDALVAEVMRQRQLNAFKQHLPNGKDAGSKGELQKNLHRDEARLMHRTVDELKALLAFCFTVFTIVFVLAWRYASSEEKRIKEKKAQKAK